MDIILDGKRSHKSFLLKKSAFLSGNVIVITGRNGSGKTRLLESIGNGSTSISVDKEPDFLVRKILFKHSELVSNMSDDEFCASSITQIDNLLRTYDRLKNEFPALLSDGIDKLEENISRIEPEYQRCYRLCFFIFEKTGKKPNSLTHNDIILHFPLIEGDLFKMENISILFNNYLKKRQQNDINKYFNEVLGKTDYYYEEEDFVKNFGDYPWIKINEIIQHSFDGKFKFTFPDVDSKISYFNAKLALCSDNEIISFQNLSSGENTLLWLTLALVSCHYKASIAGKEKKILLIDEPDAFLHPKMVTIMYKVFEAISEAFNTVVVFTTHSPTTVALAPGEKIYLVEENTVKGIEKDEAVAELLVGVTQISLNPKNRRQVFVESMYDVDVYQTIFSKLVNKSDRIDPKITLNFVSSGPKIPEQQVMEMATKHLKSSDPEQLDQFIKAINGVGTCEKVIGQVDALARNEHDSVRGIIDWDLKNRSVGRVTVFAEDYAYNIENVTLDPVCILILLYIHIKDGSFKIKEICGSDVDFYVWMYDEILLQKSVDWFMFDFFGRENKRDKQLRYTSGVSLKTDSDYLNMNGHFLEKDILKKYKALYALLRNGATGQLKSIIVNEAMIKISGGRFIPTVFEDVLIKTQK